MTVQKQNEINFALDCINQVCNLYPEFSQGLDINVLEIVDRTMVLRYRCKTYYLPLVDLEDENLLRVATIILIIQSCKLNASFVVRKTVGELWRIFVLSNYGVIVIPYAEFIDQTSAKKFIVWVVSHA